MTPRRLILDTSAYSNLRRGHTQVIEALAKAESVSVPTIVIGELEAGFALGRRYDENARALADFLDESFVTVLPVSTGVAARYGQLFADLRQRGAPVPVNDIWIAATTLEAGGTLLTFDSDFQRFSDLPLALLDLDGSG